MPLRDYRGYLTDIVEAGRGILASTKGKTFETYLEDETLRLATERRLSILGEALAQAKRHFPEVAQDISNLRQIIAFRNRLIHAYLHIDNKTVWGIVLDDIEPLVNEALAALKRLD